MEACTDALMNRVERHLKVIDIERLTKKQRDDFFKKQRGDDRFAASDFQKTAGGVVVATHRTDKGTPETRRRVTQDVLEMLAHRGPDKGGISQEQLDAAFEIRRAHEEFTAGSRVRLSNLVDTIRSTSNGCDGALAHHIFREQAYDAWVIEMNKRKAAVQRAGRSGKSWCVSLVLDIVVEGMGIREAEGKNGLRNGMAIHSLINGLDLHRDVSKWCRKGLTSGDGEAIKVANVA